MDFEEIMRKNSFSQEEIEAYVNQLLQMDLAVIMNKLTKFSIFTINKEINRKKIISMEQYFDDKYG